MMRIHVYHILNAMIIERLSVSDKLSGKCSKFLVLFTFGVTIM